MTPRKIAQISKIMTIWFKNHSEDYEDFREVPTEFALAVASDIEKNPQNDIIYDKQFGLGFSAYVRQALEEPKDLPQRVASIDKFG